MGLDKIKLAARKEFIDYFDPDYPEDDEELDDVLSDLEKVKTIRQVVQIFQYYAWDVESFERWVVKQKFSYKDKVLLLGEAIMSIDGWST